MIAAIRRSPFLILPVFVLLYGYGTIDAADFYTLSAAPFELNADAGRQFLHSSPLTFVLGYPFTRALGPRPSFVIVMGAGLAFFAVSLARLTATRYGPRRHDATLMLLTTPLLIVLTQYIGKSDAWVAGAALLLAATSNRWLQVALAAVMVLGHFEMGLLMLASMTVLRVAPWRTSLGGGAIGAALVMAYLYVILPMPPRSRADVGMVLLQEALDSVTATPVLHAIFTFGAFWVCVLAARPGHWRWLLMAAGTAAIAIVTIDFTRVFTLVGLPLAIAVVDRLVAQLEDRSPAWLNALPLLALTQVHRIGSYAYDSRLPEIAARWLG